MKNSAIKKYIENCIEWVNGIEIIMPPKYTYYVQNNKYLRLMRVNDMTGFWLLFLPIIWMFCLIGSGIGEACKFIVLFGIGAFCMRSAGVIINDIVDRNIDKSVARTKGRPIASGEVTVMEGIVICSVLLLSSIYLLSHLPGKVFPIACIAFVGVLLYPFVKRISSYSQIFLGIVFNMGVIMAWYTVQEEFHLLLLVVYSAAVFWTSAYDTVYAMQDVMDDKALGLNSLAVKLQSNTITIVSIFYVLKMVLLFLAGVVVTGVNGERLHLIYIVGLVFVNFYYKWQIAYLRENSADPDAPKLMFDFNVRSGIIIALFIVLGRI